MERVRNLVLFVLAVLSVLVVTSFANASETITYTYDAKGRLIKVEHSGSVNNGLVANYTFDHADNRDTVTVNGA